MRYSSLTDDEEIIAALNAFVRVVYIRVFFLTFHEMGRELITANYIV